MKGEIKNTSIGFFANSLENPVFSNLIDYQNLYKVNTIPNNAFITNLNNLQNIQNAYNQNFLMPNYQNVGIINNLLNFQNISQLPISNNLNNMAYLSQLNRIINNQNENVKFMGTNLNVNLNNAYLKTDHLALNGLQETVIYLFLLIKF